MPLTKDRSPLGAHPAGRYSTTGHRLYLEPAPLRVRAILGGAPVVDSTRALVLHEAGALAVWWFPRADVQAEVIPTGRIAQAAAGRVAFSDVRAGDRVAPDALQEVPGHELLDGLVTLAWDAMDEWFEEDTQIFGHLRDPYTRLEIVKSRRRVTVTLDGVGLADTRRAMFLAETSLPVRYYIPAEDVRAELVPSPLRTRCAYKGSASYWHVRVGDALHENLVWSYPVPQHEALPVRDLLCFFNERVDIAIDGAPVARPAPAPGPAARTLRWLTPD